MARMSFFLERTAPLFAKLQETRSKLVSTETSLRQTTAARTADTITVRHTVIILGVGGTGQI